MPKATITIDRAQRDGLYEVVRNHLGSIGDLFDALERDKDFVTAGRLGLGFSEDIQLLEDIGWGEKEARESFELTIVGYNNAGSSWMQACETMRKRSITGPYIGARVDPYRWRDVHHFEFYRPIHRKRKKWPEEKLVTPTGRDCTEVTFGIGPFQINPFE